MRALLVLSFLAILSLRESVAADLKTTIGGDVFASGMNAAISQPAPRDAIIAGFAVNLSGRTEKDAVAAGFDVDVRAPIGEDLYAAGFSIEVSQPVGGDLSAAGFNVRLDQDAAVGGNARVAGGAVALNGPVKGSLIASAGFIEVNGPIAGDVRLRAGSIRFGTEARIGGTLSYAAPEPIEIAPTIVPPERVHFESMDMEYGPMHPGMFRFWPAFLSVFLGFAISIAFLSLLAAALLVLTPQAFERLRKVTIATPLRNLGVGLLVLGALFGLVPVSAMTLIGIPLIPLVMLAIVAVWIAGYLVGVYAVAWGLASRTSSLPSTTPTRIVVVIIGLIVAASLNFIPFAGWLVNLGLMLLGLGGIATEALARLQEWRTRPNPPVEPPAPAT